MGESRIRPILGAVVALLVLSTLVACTPGAGGNRRAQGGQGGRSGGSADYVPLSNTDDDLPAWATNPQPGRQPQPCQAPGGPVGGPGRGAQPDRQEPMEAPPPRLPTGPAIKVVWEALAVERDRFENPRHGRKPTRGVLHQQKVVVVSASHPEARAMRQGRCIQQGGGAVAATVSDADMQVFLKGIQQRGFFRVARPTGSMQALFDDDGSRGRVTIERDGTSVSLVSQRGQGLDPSTRHVPALYSEVKQAVMLLRNRSTSMGVVDVSRESLRR